MSRPDIGPRPYSTCTPDGQIVWVMPSDPKPARKLRSRLENDDEVRARIRAAGHTPFGLSSARGNILDDYLRLYGLTARACVDEVQP